MVSSGWAGEGRKADEVSVGVLSPGGNGVFRIKQEKDHQRKPLVFRRLKKKKGPTKQGRGKTRNQMDVEFHIYEEKKTE